MIGGGGVASLGGRSSPGDLRLGFFFEVELQLLLEIGLFDGPSRQPG
jgi:hypothetical protein